MNKTEPFSPKVRVKLDPIKFNQTVSISFPSVNEKKRRMEISPKREIK